MPVLAAVTVTTAERTVTAIIIDPRTGETATVTATYLVRVPGET